MLHAESLTGNAKIKIGLRIYVGLPNVRILNMIIAHASFISYCYGSKLAMSYVSIAIYNYYGKFLKLYSYVATYKVRESFRESQ